MSIAQIADAVDRSKPTVRHWLTRYRLLQAMSRGGGGEAASEDEAEPLLRRLVGPVEFVAIAATR